MNYSPQEIIETIRMIRMEHLDIRTVTMGISLLDCADGDTDALCRKIYEKIMNGAGRLVPVCETIEKELGIPIVHKRIAVTPIALVAAGIPAGGFPAVARTLDRAASAAGVNFIGGFSALVHKGFTRGDTDLINALPGGAGRHGEGLRLGQPGDQQGGDQHGRRGADGPDHQADGRADRARGEHRLREARRLLQLSRRTTPSWRAPFTGSANRRR